MNSLLKLSNIRRMVVKIGSNVLTRDHDLNLPVIKAISHEICRLIASGLQVILVSSGALAAGMGHFQFQATGFNRHQCAAGECARRRQLAVGDQPRHRDNIAAIIGRFKVQRHSGSGTLSSAKPALPSAAE